MKTRRFAVEIREQHSNNTSREIYLSPDKLGYLSLVDRIAELFDDVNKLLDEEPDDEDNDD